MSCSGAPSSGVRTAFARVPHLIPWKIEKQHLGPIHSGFEAVEDDFLKRTLGAKEGLLLKPEMIRDCPGYMGENWDDYGTVSSQSPDPPPPMQTLHQRRPNSSGRRRLNNLGLAGSPGIFGTVPALRRPQRPARQRRFLHRNGHNYYPLFARLSCRLTFHPWDLHESFGTRFPGPSWFQMQTSIPTNADGNPLDERFLADPAFGPKYRANSAPNCMTNVFVPSRLSADIDLVTAVTRPVIFAESRRARADFERTILGNTQNRMRRHQPTPI